jgi:hypothetical protein
VIISLNILNQLVSMCCLYNWDALCFLLVTYWMFRPWGLCYYTSAKPHAGPNREPAWGLTTAKTWKTAWSRSVKSWRKCSACAVVKLRTARTSTVITRWETFATCHCACRMSCDWQSGHRFTWFSSVIKQMPRSFPRLQVATACFLCSLSM